MNARRETIILEMEDRASRRALEAAAAFKTLDASLSGIDGHASTVSRRFTSMTQRADKLAGSMGKANASLGKANGTLDAMGSRGLVKFTNQADQAAVSIDRFSGRVALLGTAVATLGPAVAPIAASLVPAVTGLASGMAGAAGAAAAAGLAFAGVGDALGALNDFQLEPSADNFLVLQQAMDKLGPAGANFVRYLDSIGGQLESLQRIAGANMFPGMTAGLQSLMTLMPRVQVLIGDLAARMGDLAADAGAALAGPEWEGFFSFLQTDAAPIFEQFTRAAGNVALALGNLMVAFAPLSRDFADGMLEASQAFASWSADSANFEGFIEYVRKAGPQVADFLGSLAEAAVALTQAVAPWGEVVLPALTTLLDLFTAVAGSPIGPELATAALAMLTFNKAAALLGPTVSGIGSSFGQMRSDLKTVAGGWVLASSATERESKKMAGATGRLKANMTEIGKTAGIVGAVGLAASGAAAGIGLQNTAMLASAGLMAGGWGAAIGAGVGLVLDFKAAQEQAAAAAKDFAATLDSQTGDITGASSAYVASKFTSDQIDRLHELGLNVGDVSEALAGGTKTWDAYYNSLNSNQKLMLRTRESFLDFSPFINELDKMAKESDDGAASFDAQGEAIDGTAAAASAAVTSFNELTAAQQAQTQASLAGIDAGTAYGAALDKAAKQAESAEQGFDRFTEAGRNNRTAMTQLVNAYNQQPPALKNSVKGYRAAREEIAELGKGMGLSAARIRELQGYLDKPAILRIDSREAQAAIRGAKSAFESLPGEVQTELSTRGVPRTTAQVDALVAKYRLTEEQRTALITLKDAASAGLGNILTLIRNVKGKTVTVGVNTGNAVSNVRAVQAVINSLSGKTVTVTTLQRTIYAAGKMDSIAKAQGKADGGEILGQRQPYGDKVLLWAAPGEEVISNRHGQADAFRRDRAAGRIPAYADGGTIRGYATGGKVAYPGEPGNEMHSWAQWAKIWDRAAKGTERALKDHGKQLDRATDRLDYWNNKRNELKSAVSGSLTRDWFSGGSTDPWSGGLQGGTIAYAQSQWKKQAADSNRLTKVVANLKKRGAGDAFIAEILRSEDPLAAAEMFNKQTVAGTLQSQKLFLSATRATASAASYTSGVVFGDEIAKSTAEVRHIRGDLKHLSALLKRQHRESEASKKKYSASKAASKGSRSQKR